MDVSVSRLRADLSSYLDDVRRGDEIVVTERGVPVARLVRADTAPLIERLVASGVVAMPSVASRPAAASIRRVRANGGALSELVSEQRDEPLPPQ